jgi:hypothetical protein
MSENEWMISAPGGVGSEGSVGGVSVAWKGTGGERGVASSFLFSSDSFRMDLYLYCEYDFFRDTVDGMVVNAVPYLTFVR